MSEFIGTDPVAWQFRMDNGNWVVADAPDPEELRHSPERFRRVYAGMTQQSKNEVLQALLGDMLESSDFGDLPSFVAGLWTRSAIHALIDDLEHLIRKEAA